MFLLCIYQTFQIFGIPIPWRENPKTPVRALLITLLPTPLTVLNRPFHGLLQNNEIVIAFVWGEYQIVIPGEVIFARAKTLGFTSFDVQLLIMKNDITEILLKVAINTIKPISLWRQLLCIDIIKNNSFNYKYITVTPTIKPDIVLRAISSSFLL